MSNTKYSIKDEFSKLEELAFQGKWDEDTSTGIKLYAMTRAGGDVENHGFLHDRLQDLCLIRMHIQNKHNLSANALNYIVHYLQLHPSAKEYVPESIKKDIEPLEIIFSKTTF